MATKRPEVKAAHWTVSNATRRGKLVKPSTLLCVDCGNPAQCYDHYLGYAKKHRLDIQAVCYSCHQKRAWTRGEMKATVSWRTKIRQRMQGNQYGAGHKRSPEHIEIIRQTHTGNSYALGRHHTPDACAKISVANKGKIISAEVRRKISVAKKGKKLSPESIKKAADARRGLTRSEETKRKMSESRKRWWQRKKEMVTV